MRLGAVCLLMLQSTSAFAGSAGLALKVVGEVLPAPRFTDAEGTTVSVISLTFLGMAKETSDESVDSVQVSLRLLGASQYPADVTFQRPRGCQIGTQSISDTKVRFTANGNSFDADGLFSIPSSGAVAVGLRFEAASSLSGSVECQFDGGLVYSY